MELLSVGMGCCNNRRQLGLELQYPKYIHFAVLCLQLILLSNVPLDLMERISQ